MLNEEVLDSLQKVNVNLVFYGDNITINIQRDKPIDLIYRSAYDYFKPHGKIKLYYKNKELTPFLNYTIGKYFKKLKNIDILVKDSSRMDNTFDNQLLLNSNFNLEHLNKLNSSNTLQINKTIATNIQNKTKTNLPQNQRAMTFCWDCKKFPINIFCRDCGAFVCKYCRMDLENAHYSHRTVTLYPENLAKSANLYKNILIEDLNEVEKISMNRNKINEEKKEININIDEKKSHLIIKINRLINKINQIKSYQREINYYIKNKDKCKKKISKAIKEINSISDEYTQKNITENSIETTNNNNSNIYNYKDIIKTSSKNNVKDLKEIFTKMNTIEKNTEKICKIGKTIEEWEEINKKLELSLKSVENKIYTIIEEAADGEDLNYENSDEKNEANVNNNINDDKNKEEKEEEKKEEIKEEKKEEIKEEKKEEIKEEKKELDLKEENDKKNENNKEIDKNEEKKESGNEEEYEYEEIEEEVEGYEDEEDNKK